MQVATPDVRLASGETVVIDWSAIARIIDVRRQVSEQLRVPLQTVKLLDDTGNVLNDSDDLNRICGGASILVVLQAIDADLLQSLARWMQTNAAMRQTVDQLAALQELRLDNKHLTALPESFG